LFKILNNLELVLLLLLLLLLATSFSVFQLLVTANVPSLLILFALMIEAKVSSKLLFLQEPHGFTSKITEFFVIMIYFLFIFKVDCPCRLIDFLAADPKVPGSIPGATRFSE
jgi:hypothetical protein